MTVYCHGDCHVWLGASSLCTCEAHRVAMLYVNKYATITQRISTGGYIAYHPELPTVISQADTPEEARANLVEATEAAVSHLVESGLPIPEPATFPLAIDLAAMYGLQLPYNPFGPHAPQKASQTDVPLEQFKAAQAVNATHLSKDGSKVYQTRYNKVYEADWQGGTFGAWWPLDGELPGDAVRIE